MAKTMEMERGQQPAAITQTSQQQQPPPMMHTQHHPTPVMNSQQYIPPPYSVLHPQPHYDQSARYTRPIHSAEGYEHDNSIIISAINALKKEVEYIKFYSMLSGAFLGALVLLFLTLLAALVFASYLKR